MNNEKKEYILENDKVQMEEYQDKVNNITYKENYLYHLDVLPQPFFGDVSNADVLILAKNPSYAMYEDEYDTWTYEKYITEQKSEINLNDFNDNYYKILKNVDFFKKFDNKFNSLFFNTWKWWNKNVIGEGVKPKSDTKVAFVNYCQYHSKEYYNVNYNSFQPSDEIIKQLKNNLDKKLIIIVWGDDLWKNVLGNKNTIILNKNLKIDSLSKILEQNDDERYLKLKHYFYKDVR